MEHLKAQVWFGGGSGETFGVLGEPKLVTANATCSAPTLPLTKHQGLRIIDRGNETMGPMAKEAKDKIIVALDTQSLEEAIAAVKELSEYVGAFKVGLELLTAEGSKAVVQSIHSF